MKITRDFVIQNLADSGLMSADDASSLCESLSSISGPTDPDAVVQELSGTDKLTAYQAQCICRGETSGLVFGDYVVLDKIGQGGMGVVLKAQHTRMERIVAVKKLTSAALQSEDLVKRFYREVKASARLLHRNVVRALDAREHEGVHYLIMEYIDGQDLAEVLKERGPLPVDEAVDYVVQAAQGLDFAHKHGVFHRDIKPSNLMLVASGGRAPTARLVPTGTSTNQPADAGRSPGDGTPHSAVVKILDMGLARIVSEAKAGNVEQLTNSGQVMGTCDYMAPEQAENTSGVDHRADIYSLGCTLYRLITGDPPYTGGGNLMQLLLAHREDPIPSICAKRPDVPASVDAVFQRMVAKTPEARYQSMTEVIDALQAALGRGPAAAPAADPGLMDFLQQIPQEPSAASRIGRGSGKTDAAQAAATVQQQADPIYAETIDYSATADTDPSTVSRQPAAPAARQRRPAPRRKPKQAPMLVVIGAGIGISLIGAAVVAAVLYVQTDYGTVVVKTEDKNVQVLVKRGGNQVYVADAKNQWCIDVKSGEYSVELKGGNDRFVLDNDTITVTRGDEVRVRVERRPRPKPPRPAIASSPPIDEAPQPAVTPDEGPPEIKVPGWRLVNTVPFESPAGIAYNPADDRLYAIRRGKSYGRGGLYRIDPEGTAVCVARGDRPAAVVVDPDDGDVFFSEDYGGNIFRSPFGETGRSTWVSGLDSKDSDPIGMAVAPNDYRGDVIKPGEALVVDRGHWGPDNVWRFSPDEPEEKVLVHKDDGTLINVLDVTIGSHDIYLVDTADRDGGSAPGRIYRLGAGGSLTRIELSEPIITPNGIATDPISGDLLVLEAGAGRLLRVDPDTGTVTTMFTGFRGPLWAGVDVTPDGRRIFISDPPANKIYVFETEKRPDGKLPPDAPNP